MSTYANSRQMYIYSLDSGVCVHALRIFRMLLLWCVIDVENQQSLLQTHTSTDIDLASQASKARLSDCRRRPPAARRDHQGIADVILWRRFRSGTVIMAVDVERGLGRRVLFSST